MSAKASPIERDDRVSHRSPIVASWSSGDDCGPRRAAITHGYAALSYFTSGRTRMEQGGEWKVGEGDVLIVPAGAPHRRIEAQRPQFWGVAICTSCLASDGAASMLEPFERVRAGGSPVVQIPKPRRPFLVDLFRELEAVSNAAEVDTDVSLAVPRSLLVLILNEVDRAARTIATSTTPVHGNVVADALRFIERNCLRRLTLSEIAKAVGRTPTYVTSALTRATGRSAVQWIVSGRMAEARRLLLHSGEDVDIVAERVGYADTTHFIRMFRREHGATPAAWRAAQTAIKP